MTEIFVRSYDWKIKEPIFENKEFSYEEENNDVNEETQIHGWCLNKESESCLIKITDFPIFCFLELPFIVHNKPFTWNKYRADDFARCLEKKLNVIFFPERIQYKELKKLYYYNGERKYPMLRIFFKNTRDMKRFSYKLNKPIELKGYGLVKCNIHEEWISIVRKMLSAKGLGFCQWIKITEANEVLGELKESSAKHEYNISWDNMENVDSKISDSWATNPTILSFDIECYSSKKLAMPDKQNPFDVAYLITGVFQKLGHKESRERFALIYGDCNEIPKEKLESAEIRKFNTEEDMIFGYCDLIIEKDPIILTGYNIMGFDYPYLEHRRALTLNEWKKEMSKNKLYPPKMTNSRWKSGAYGFQDINNLEMDGRISVDVLPIVRRNYKMDKYSLGFVTEQLLGRTKLDMPAKRMFEIFARFLKAWEAYKENLMNEKLSKDDKDNIIKEYEESKAELTEVVEYGIRDSDLVVDLFEKMYVWIDITELSNIVGVTPVEIFTRGQQIRCVSQLYDLCTKKGVVIDKRDNPVMHFSGGAVQSPLVGVHDNVICVDFKSLYPNIIRAFNLCYSTLVPKRLHNDIPEDQYNDIEVEQEEEITGNKINYDEDVPDNISEDDEEIEDLEGDEKEKKKIKKIYKFKFINKKTKEGILPSLVGYLIDERNRVKGQMKDAAKAGNKLLEVVLDKKQNALKVSANSFFGFMAANMLPCMEIAISITGLGRKIINDLAGKLREKYGVTVVYGDTDSLMFKKEGLNSIDSYKLGEEITDYINGIIEGKPKTDKTIATETIPALYPAPLEVEFEKMMKIFVKGKKMYFYYLYDKKGEFKMMLDKNKKPILDEDGKPVPHMEKKGVLLARRDNFKLAQKIYERVAREILNGVRFEVSMLRFIEDVQKILNGQVDIKNLVYIRTLGANYKSDSYFMKLFGDNLKKAGKIVSPGDRLEYLIIEKPGEKLLGNRMVLPEQYYESQSDSSSAMKIDYSYYVEKGLKSLDDLYAIAYGKTIERRYSNIYVQPTARNKPIYMTKIIEMLIRMHQHRDKYDKDQIEETKKVLTKKMNRVRIIEE